jgi:putative ABC transport system permease protein
MMRHLLRLMWNRKRRNALLGIEIFFSFAVVAVIAVFAVNYVNNWRHGIGYRIDDVWNIEVTPTGQQQNGEFPAGTGRRFANVMAVARELAGVQAIAAVNISPYSNNTWTNVMTLKDGRREEIRYNAASDDLPSVLGIDLVAGRWFTPEDNRDDVRALVMNQLLATDIFGGRDPIGQLVPDTPPPSDRRGQNSRWRPSRVVGVVREFRQDGEFATPQKYAFVHIDFAQNGFGNSILVRTAPGMAADFEERLQKAAQQVAPEWSIRTRRLEDDRHSSMRTYTALLVVPAVIAGFLLVMVALGLTGVLWQHVTERTREFGLRRAAGASAGAIRRQVFAELVVLASFALVPGAILGFQLPALPIPDEVVPGRVIIAGVAVSLAAIYLGVLACGWYPSRMATAIRPAEALHYE